MNAGKSLLVELGTEELPPRALDELSAAFLRGMGMDEADFPGRDPVADMEKFGREYRPMMEGLMQLLRKRVPNPSV